MSFHYPPPPEGLSIAHPRLIEGPFMGLRRNYYRFAFADPAWKYVTRSDKGQGRSASRHYGVMTLDEIKALPVATIMHKHSAIGIWTTDTHLAQAIEVINEWGFKYKTVLFYWVKDTANGKRHFGMGHWTRANPEPLLLGLTPELFDLMAEEDCDDNMCLLATRGSPKRVARDVRKLIEAKVREHSRKPEEAYERIMRLVDGPYLSLFEREGRDNWATWGNEKRKFNRRQRHPLI